MKILEGEGLQRWARYPGKAMLQVDNPAIEPAFNTDRRPAVAGFMVFQDRKSIIPVWYILLVKRKFWTRGKL